MADLKAGRAPDPKYGKIAKLRSTHNNYLTLPVIFLMLSNHYPLAFASQYNWLIAALIFLMGVTIRHFFNTLHARGGYQWWTWAVTTILFVAIMWLSAMGLNQDTYEEAEARALTPIETKFADAEGFDQVADIIVGRCSMCHAREPVFEGIHHAPKGVFLETRADIARLAREVYVQSGLTDAMPPANITSMEPDERRQVIRWFRQIGGTALAGI